MEEDEDFIDVETHDASSSETMNRKSPETTEQKEIDIDVLSDDPNFQPPKLDYEAIGEFCFESDELALKGNTDYKNLLEAIVVLEAQRAKAVKDLELLQSLKEEALADPFAFLERMRRKEAMNFPTPQKIHPVPTIDWGKYAISGDPAAFERRQLLQRRQQSQKSYRNSNKKAKLYVVNNEETQFLHPWTSLDESRLKELLKEFPPETVEALRWEKIAASLGNHSPFEVASKVHEEYDDLITHVGDTLGNKPDLSSLKKNWSTSNVEKDCTSTPESTQKDLHETPISDDEDISLDLQDTPEYRELMLLKKALRERLTEEFSDTTQHAGYKCCCCKTEPIVGTRWHCLDCKPPLSIDFCEDCAERMYETRQHTSDHQLEKIPANKGFLDRDYMHFLGGDYNYLDPNYMPAT